MAFEIPPESFNPKEHARNKAIRSNQFLATVLQQFIASYEEFWGVSGSMQPVIDEKGQPVLDGDGNQVTEFVGNGSRYTTEEMQSVMDELGPANVVAILTQSQGFIQFLVVSYPGELPERYHLAAFDYTTDLGRIHLVGVNKVWAKKEEQ